MRLQLNVSAILALVVLRLTVRARVFSIYVFSTTHPESATKTYAAIDMKSDTEHCREIARIVVVVG